MRLEHLRITAFGPFADTVEVDFAALSDAGLFLLTGPTGAGKSSVLDAVCFAFYGVVPGERSDAKHLRSDHAATGVVPEVELRATVGGRTFTFRRSPVWERPKKRGSGTTRQQPTVCVEELVAGSWEPLTTRMDDAGHFVTELLGMTATQFTQVAMLPQGGFQKFLHASSRERHEVLQRLFRTDRFQRIEQWLVEHRRELRRECDTHAGTVTALVQRISEVADVPVPGEFDGQALSPTDEALAGWASERVDHAMTHLEDARTAAVTAEEAHTAARAAHDAAMARDRARQRGRDARAVLATLEEAAGEAARQDRALAGHRRAAPLRALLAQAEDAGQAHAAAQSPVAELAGVAGLDEPSLDTLAPRLATALDEVAAARAALPLEQRLEDAAKELGTRTDARAALDDEVTRLETDLESLPASVRDLEERHAAAVTASARLDGLRAEVTRTTTGLEAATTVDRLAQDEATARLALQEATDEAQSLREAWLTAREARINAMAGELAGNLAAGCSCPVCGSVDHPAPAHRADGAGKAEEDAAQRAYETADTARLATAEALSGVSAQLAAVRATAGDLDAAGWQRLVDDAGTALSTAEEVAEGRTDIAAALTEARTRLEQADTRLEAARTDRAAALAAESEAGRTHTALTAEVESARAGFDSVAARVADASDRRDRLVALKDALEAAGRAAARRKQADEDLATAARKAGFETVADAAAALLDDDAAAQAETFLRERDQRAAVARAVLDEPEVRAADAGGDVDLAALGVALDEAADAHKRAGQALARAGRTRERLQALDADLTIALGAWEPVHEAWQVAASVSALAEGTSTDNAVKMRLSAYVLSERLRQVVATANTRLARMTDARYALEHTDERTVGAKRGGLGLWVRDDWTGARRDPATLSGGETFVVSLALALGLADTVTHEAGGTEIDTLFIDEGFGSLDSETLDDVMDTLDSLREGGRVVGVVSHVPEMRERIPAGLEVIKARTGSQLATR